MRTDGKKIRELRISKGLTQTEFANAVGISQSFLSSVENGYCDMSKAVLMLIDIKFGKEERSSKDR